MELFQESLIIRTRGHLSKYSQIEILTKDDKEKGDSSYNNASGTGISLAKLWSRIVFEFVDKQSNTQHVIMDTIYFDTNKGM